MQWGFLQSDLGSPWENMATDEYLLTLSSQRQFPILRCYGWQGDAVSFGYFQSFDQIASLTSVRPLVRRPTGGGLVSHVQDWTYSVAIPSSCEWYQLKACESYCRMHQWAHTALRSMGLETVLAEEAIESGPGQCFIGAEKHDILYKGFKIAGAAQRRTRHGLLIQGSIQIPDVTNAANQSTWIESLQSAGINLHGIKWQPIHLTSFDGDHVNRLKSEKYKAESFNKRK